MKNKRAILIASAVAGLLLIGGAVAAYLMWPRENPSPEPLAIDETESVTLTDRNNQTPDASVGDYPARSDYDGNRTDDDGQVPIDELDIPEPEPEPDVRESPILSGRVAYKDIPAASTIDGGYKPDEITQELVSYLQDAYPTEVIAEISLMGNGSATSQENGLPTSYASYLITFQSGTRIGLTMTCSDEYPPYATETNYLVVNQNLLYKVKEDEYVPMDTSLDAQSQ